MPPRGHLVLRRGGSRGRPARFLAQPRRLRRCCSGRAAASNYARFRAITTVLGTRFGLVPKPSPRDVVIHAPTAVVSIEAPARSDGYRPIAEALWRFARIISGGPSEKEALTFSARHDGSTLPMGYSSGSGSSSVTCSTPLRSPAAGGGSRSSVTPNWRSLRSIVQWRWLPHAQRTSRRLIHPGLGGGHHWSVVFF
jgi:hypothetical protein